MKRSVVNSGFLPLKKTNPQDSGFGRLQAARRVSAMDGPSEIIRAGIVIGTHNGTIYNADYLFRRLGPPRYAEVDSELIFRLADRFAPEGPIDQKELKKALALCRGQMSAVLASKLDPDTITVLKGNKPLCLALHRPTARSSAHLPALSCSRRVDRPEGFRPGGHSMYQRVMVAVLSGRTSISAWTYWMSCPPYEERVASDQWLRP